MKNTGIVRKVDELGRVVIPMEIRKKFKIKENAELEIFIEKGNIVLHKNSDKNCPFCYKKCDKDDKYCSKCGYKFD